MRWCVVLLCALLFGARASAQRVGTGDPPGYREIIAEALTEFDAKNYEEARALFARANTLSKTARTLRGLGYAEFELRAYRDAVGHLEEALASSAKPLDGVLRVETQRILDRAYGFIARIRVSVTPPNASLSVDGIAMGDGQEHALILDMGEHVVEASATSYVTARQVVRLTGGENESLRVALTVLPPESSASEPATPLTGADSSSRRPVYKNPWLWTTLGVVLAGAAVGLGFALREPVHHSEEAYGGNTGVVFQSP